MDSLDSGEGSQKPTNSILATIVVLCTYEIKWPTSGLWKVHLRAARTVIKRWASSNHTIQSDDPITSFLLHELFATQAMASITNLGLSDEPIFVNLQIDKRVSFMKFFHALESMSKRDFDGIKNVLVMHEFEAVLENAYGHALDFWRDAPFRSQQDR
jgi:hypothetical protein